MVGAVGLASMLIALSFAEVSSRFEGTGGPISTPAPRSAVRGVRSGLDVVVHARRELGRRDQRPRDLTRVLLAGPARRDSSSRRDHADHPRLPSTFAVRQSSIVVNVLTIGKLVPLLVFIAVGLFAIDPAGWRSIDR